ncbi:MAG: HlyD family efflux transporter periplasmic adaptor subunit, partial [Ruminococcus sp.]|nr:HlyD family efflux transporter periplasmic adaptor subunit [Ruminococcus sp.]
DVLFELEDADSTELKEAQSALDKLELDHQKALLALTEGTGHEAEYLEIRNAESELANMKGLLSDAQRGTDILSKAIDDYKQAKAQSDDLTREKENLTAQLASVDTEDMLDLAGEYYDRIRAAKDNVSSCEKKAEKAKDDYDELSKEVSENSDYASQIESKRNELESERASLNQYYVQLYSAAPDEDTASISSAISSSSVKISQLERELSNLMAKSASSGTMKLKLTNAENAKKKADDNLTAAKDKLAEEIRSIKLAIKKETDIVTEKLNKANDLMTSADERKKEAEEAGYMSAAQLETKINDAEKNITKLKNELSVKISGESVENEKAKLDIAAQEKEIEKQKQTVEKLKSEAFDAVVKAKVGGVVESVSVTAGEEAAAGSTAAVINVSDKGYTVEFSVKSEQARKVKTGDKAEITSWYWGDDFSAVLTEIKPDTANPQTQKLLVFNVSGADISTGQTITLAMGSKGQSYSTVVPNSAVREDSNGKFVLAMESKSSPLGNRYKAVRYDIEVVAKDDNYSAVNGLMGSEFVITASTKPIEAGEQVRPAE